MFVDCLLREGWEWCIDSLLHKGWMGGVYRLSITLGVDGRGV